jgi:endonuclease YncB( thermonuclease family)
MIARRSIPLFTLFLFSLPLRAQSWHTVERIVDGDTIVLDGSEKVRLIGVDTPETVDPRKPVEYFGKEAVGLPETRAALKRALDGIKWRAECRKSRHVDIKMLR